MVEFIKRKFPRGSQSRKVLKRTAVLMAMIAVVFVWVYGKPGQNTPSDEKPGWSSGIVDTFWILAGIVACALVGAWIVHALRKWASLDDGEKQKRSKTIRDRLRISIASIVWLIFVLCFWTISSAWPAPWSFIWGNDWEGYWIFTILTFILLLVWSIFNFSAKEETDEKAAVIRNSTRAIFLLIASLWIYAFWNTEPVQRVWKDIASQDFATNGIATNTDSDLRPSSITITAPRDRYSPEHVVLSTSVYDCAITFDGRVEIVPNRDPSRKFQMDQHGKRDDRGGGPVSKVLQFKSLEPDRDVTVTITYIPKRR